MACLAFKEHVSHAGAHHVWNDVKDFASCLYPSLSALPSRIVPGLAAFRVWAVVVYDDGQGVDAGEHRKFGDSSGIAESPCWPKSELHAGERGFDAFPDVQRGRNILFAGKLDGGAADGAEGHAVNLAAVRCKGGTWIATGLLPLIAPNRATMHGCRFGRMKAQDAAVWIRKFQLSGPQIGFRDRAGDWDGSAPNLAGPSGVIVILSGRRRRRCARRWRSLSSRSVSHAAL